MSRPFDGKRFNLAMVAAIAFGIGFIALGYLNYAQFTANQQSQSLLQGQITDLTYQVKQDHATGLAASPSPSPSPSPSDSLLSTPSPRPTPSPSTAVLAANTAAIKTPHNIHASASSSSPVVLNYSSLHAGEYVTLDGSAQGIWQKVTINGVTGYTEASSF